MKKIDLSIIIATYNSQNLLPKVLKSIQNQKKTSFNYEILIIDGGSTDETIKIAREEKCVIIKNPRTEPVYGKFIGYKKAKGKYVMYLDHDEVLVDKNSLNNRLEFFRKNSDVKMVAGGNYINPKSYPFINQYINEFGDPFSFYIYHISKANKWFLYSMKEKYPIYKKANNFYIFNFKNRDLLPLIEMVAGGSIFDADYLKRNFLETKKDYRLTPHYFYLMIRKSPYLAVAKNDPIMHYSADTLIKYFKKINWRVKNNIYHISTIGMSGYSGREQYLSSYLRFKKYLYIPYVFSFVVLIYDAIRLSVSRKDVRYMLHIPLSIFTAGSIIYYMTLKTLGVEIKLKNYDNTKIIDK